MLRGGGVAFGPKPRDFSSELPKKVYDLAWRTALSYRFRQGELIIVDNAMEIESPSAKLLGDIFKHHEKLRGRGRSLMVTLEERPLLEQALVEMDRGEQTLTWEEVDVKNLLELSRVIIERDALHNILLTHEEDLTHKSLQPWHKSLIRSSPPADLEATIGWSEFRELSLVDPKEKETARAETYESVASTRYGYAESLPQSLKRTELTASALSLLAEAKELRFAEKTGLSFADYLEVSEPARYPRVQAIDYQINVKSDLMNTAEETSRLQAEELLVEIRELEEQRAELQYDAAILAAQVHEQRSEALRINGEAEIAEDVYAMAQGERTNVEVMELELLKAKLGTAEKKMDVAALRNDYAAQQKAKKEVSECSQLVQELEALRAAGLEEVEDVDEVDVQEPIEAPKVEAREEKRV
jgi:large subunit ribosomal protein L4